MFLAAKSASIELEILKVNRILDCCAMEKGRYGIISKPQFPIDFTLKHSLEELHFRLPRAMIDICANTTTERICFMGKRPYAIGLDIGIASVGWAVVALDENERPCGIYDLGVRTFPRAEHPKTGESLAAPRRAARSARRRIRRHRHRNERIRNLIVSSGLLMPEQLETLFDGKLEDIYTLRVRALDEVLNAEEYSRVLIHLSQRRGFRSNRLSGEAKEDGKILAAVSENKQRMEKNGYRTVGEMLLKDAQFSEHKRNCGGDYLGTVSRSMVEEEVRLLFESQRRLGASFATEDLEQAYLEILLSQRSFDEGPGGNSPYGGNQILKNVGQCTFEEGEFRAAKASYSCEYFTLLEKINHLRLVSDSVSAALDSSQRDALIKLAHNTESVDFSKIRKTLALEDSVRFNIVRYSSEQTQAESEKKTKFQYLKGYHAIRKALNAVAKGRISHLSRQQLNTIAITLSSYKTESNIRLHLEEAGIENCDIDALMNVGSFSKFGHLSIKAYDKLIPFLEQGMNYNEACVAAGYDFKGHNSDGREMYLHPSEQDLEDITSPVVRRAVSQTTKVINAIIRKQGQSPMFLNIELAREMTKTLAERNKADASMQQNRAENERRMERLRTELGCLSPKAQDLVKLKLYEQQDGICAYSLKPLSLERLFEPGYAEIDHIIPYSLSFDDSYKNKVLVLAAENRNKGNRLPLQYLIGERRDRFIVWTNAHVKDYRKRQNLLKPAITDEDEARFKERNLQDTKYIARFMLNYIQDNLLFAPSATGRKKHVTAVNGTVTSYMRSRWGIAKIRANGDLHHAADALVVACTTDGMIREISRYAQLRECEYTQTDTESLAIDPKTGEILKQFPHPWNGFRKELEARLSSNPRAFLEDLRLPFYYDEDFIDQVRPVLVSRMPNRKVTGAAHKDTVRSPKAIDAGMSVSKKALTDLKLDKNGEIAGYYAKESDRLLYEALVKQLKAYGGDAKKAFAEPFHKPKKDGTPGPIVKKVQIQEKSSLNVLLHNGQGIAANDTMVRIDVFYVEDDGYYLIPIYVADTLKPELPSLACVAHKPYSAWKPMKEEDFLFSLYPDDLIKIRHRSGFKLEKNNQDSTLSASLTKSEALMYYGGADIDGGKITLRSHDNAYSARVGIKTLVNMEKYTVDVLGEYHLVKKETRMPFVIKRG